MKPTTPGFLEWLSTLSVLQILAAVAILTAARVLAVKWLARSAKSPVSGVGRTTIEIADSLIYAFAITFLLIRPLVAQPFYVPTGSMEPTLRGDSKDNDRVWVDKISYRMHTPNHGDVVVFTPPESALRADGLTDTPGQDHFIKRLIAVGGDRIQATAGKLYVNGAEYSHNDARETFARNGLFGSTSDNDPEEYMATDHVKFVPDGVIVNGKLVSKEQVGRIFTGTPGAKVTIVPGRLMVNGKTLDEPYIAEDPDYDLRIYHGMPLKEDYGRGEYKLEGVYISKSQYDSFARLPNEPLPKGTYFMMGDNRNDSSDSTEWGTITADHVVGKADVIFWPPNRVNWDL